MRKKGHFTFTLVTAALRVSRIALLLVPWVSDNTAPGSSLPSGRAVLGGKPVLSQNLNLHEMVTAEAPGCRPPPEPGTAARSLSKLKGLETVAGQESPPDLPPLTLLPGTGHRTVL